jgi:RNA polymerase sigma factor (TIGR02999 family)
MPDEIPKELTMMLNAAAQGDDLAAERVWHMVYADLRKIASEALGTPRLGERHAPGATTIVEQAFLNLYHSKDGEGVPWTDRKTFFVAIGRELARFLIEHRRKNPSLPRGGFARVLPLGLDFDAIASFDTALIATDSGVFEALDRLHDDHPRAAESVWLRYVCGLTIQQTSTLLGIKCRTVCKHWNYAKAWIRRDLDTRFGRTLPDAI